MIYLTTITFPKMITSFQNQSSKSMVCIKFISITRSQIIFHLFDQFYLELVLENTILKNYLYQPLKNLLLMNILYVLRFLFARKLKVRIPHCLWIHLTFSHSLLTRLCTKQKTSVLIDCVRIKEK